MLYLNKESGSVFRENKTWPKLPADIELSSKLRPGREFGKAEVFNKTEEPFGNNSTGGFNDLMFLDSPTNKSSMLKLEAIVRYDSTGITESGPCWIIVYNTSIWNKMNVKDTI